MVAEQHTAIISMTPAISVLQLDTAFPRIPGDVACPATYIDRLEVLSVRGATVTKIVSDRPDLIDVSAFENALARAQGDVVVTSCGFLSYWQNHLASQTKASFISSALTALPRLSQTYKPGEILILTFDADRLKPLHFGDCADYACGIIGLPKEMHLRQVIGQNLSALDPDLAAQELSSFVADHVKPTHKHLLLECTNLPPYKAALRRATGLPITNILTEIERVRPGSIQTEFL